VGISDLRLGPHDPLGHRRLRDHEGPGDLGRREAAEQSEGQRDLSQAGKGRMAAGEHQAEPVVAHCGHPLWLVVVMEEDRLYLTVVS
jgi:hypothetical protein